MSETNPVVERYLSRFAAAQADLPGESRLGMVQLRRTVQRLVRKIQTGTAAQMA